MSRCRDISMGEVPAPITNEARYFINGKWKMYIDDKCIYFWLYGSEGTPIIVFQICHRSTIYLIVLLEISILVFLL